MSLSEERSARAGTLTSDVRLRRGDPLSRKRATIEDAGCNVAICRNRMQLQACHWNEYRRADWFVQAALARTAPETNLTARFTRSGRGRPLRRRSRICRVRCHRVASTKSR